MSICLDESELPLHLRLETDAVVSGEPLVHRISVCHFSANSEVCCHVLDEVGEDRLVADELP